MTPPGRERARFSGFELDLQSAELWDDAGRRAFLPNQPFRILAALVRAGGEVVTRESLRRELWPDDTFVDYEHSLNAAIKRLRETLGDSAASPRFIETIPRHGYRFIAATTAITDGAPALPSEVVAPQADTPEFAVTGSNGRAIGSTWHAIAAGWLILSVAALVAWRWIEPKAAGSDTRPAPVLVRLTSSSGLNIDPALSPDGSLLTYASDREDRSGLDIWVQPVAGGTPRRLTSDEGDETEPSFSPDGSYIVYSRREIDGVYRVGVLGGEPRKIVHATRARTPRVSPDGRWILYWTGQPVWGSGGLGPVGATAALALVPVEGGAARELAPDFASARYGIWSPDGRRILFLGEGRDDRSVDWYVISRDGGKAIRTGAMEVLRKANVIGDPIPGDWTADSDAVVFVIAGGENSNVWKLPISPETGTVNGALERLTFGSGQERTPRASRVGRIAFASIVENIDVWRVGLSDGHAAVRGSLQTMPPRIK